MHKEWNEPYSPFSYAFLDPLAPGADFVFTKSLRRVFETMSLRDLGAYFGTSQALSEDIFGLFLPGKPSRPTWTWYAGEAFKFLKLPELMTQPQHSGIFQRASRGILVLSAMYGCVLPWEPIQGYRLDFTLPPPIELESKGSLRSLWAPRVRNRINTMADTYDIPLIISCASEEYEDLLSSGGSSLEHTFPLPLVKIRFTQAHPKTGKRAKISARVKQARGLFARWVIETLPEKTQEAKAILEHLKTFCLDRYSLVQSSEEKDEWVLTFHQVSL